MTTTYIEADFHKERVYAYGYEPMTGRDADLENEMQEYVDDLEPDTWVVEEARYFEDDDCWSARLRCIYTD